MMAACLALALGAIATGCGGDDKGNGNGDGGGSDTVGRQAGQPARPGRRERVGRTRRARRARPATGTAARATAGPAGCPALWSSRMIELPSSSPRRPAPGAGHVTIKAPNLGDREHELVLLKTDLSPGSLPVKNGQADEKAGNAEDVLEIEHVKPGKTKKASANLEPGNYVLVCNIPGHYQAGMYGGLTVK